MLRRVRLVGSGIDFPRVRRLTSKDNGNAVPALAMATKLALLRVCR